MPQKPTCSQYVNMEARSPEYGTRYIWDPAMDTKKMIEGVVLNRENQAVGVIIGTSHPRVLSQSMGESHRVVDIPHTAKLYVIDTDRPFSIDEFIKNYSQESHDMSDTLKAFLQEERSKPSAIRKDYTVRGPQL